MDSPTIELKSALASLFEDPKYSDLTISCRGKRYPVHRALLATRSTFFQGACRNAFLESQTGVIDLSEDDPEAVDHMIYYFYHLDYLTKSTSRQSPQEKSRPSRAGKLNFALMEDPLLASISGNSNSMSLTPPPEAPTLQSIDASSKPIRTPTDDHSEADDYFVMQPSDPLVSFETPHLVSHAKVYAIAEKYGITALKALSRKKFAQAMALALDTADFPEACQEAYESTFHTDRGLRDIIVQAFRANPDLSFRPDVEIMVRETPSLAFELFRMASGLPVSS